MKKTSFHGAPFGGVLLGLLFTGCCRARKSINIGVHIYVYIYILCIQYTHICPNVHPKLSRCCGFPCFPYIRGPDQKWVWLRPANWNKPSHNHPPSRLYSSEVNIQTSALRKEEHIPNHPKEKQLLPIPSCPSYPITKAAKAAKAAKALSTWMNFCKT